MKPLIVILAFLVFPGAAYAEETAQEALVRMSGKISDEYSACAAYFDVASKVMQEENKAYQEKYQALKNESIAFALGFAKMEKDDTAAADQVSESYKNAMYRMVDARKEGREQFADLIKEQSAYCPRLMKDPTVVMEKI